MRLYEMLWDNMSYIVAEGAMTNMNISLPETLKTYVEEQVAAGGYGTASEYLRELIREDKKRKAQARLESFLLEGLDSGDPVPVTPEFWQGLWGRVDGRQQAKQGARG
jgi:antitoxin ParD1/3/4